MNKQYFIPDKNGFYGVYYSNKEKSEQVMIAMLGDSSDDCMYVSSVKWLQCINHVSGASTAGMLALIATSYFHGISLTLAMCPCDFIMEGFYQDGQIHLLFTELSNRYFEKSAYQ